MNPSERATTAAGAELPAWARELSAQYESGSANSFILHGNIHDRMLLPAPAGPRLGSLEEFLLEVLLPRFDVILRYDLGHGLRVLKGGEAFARWPSAREEKALPRAPRAAIETLSHYARYLANLGRLGQERLHVAFLLRHADLLLPVFEGGLSYDLSAQALMVRGWSEDTALLEHPFATLLLCENLNDLNPIVANNPRASRVELPLPDADQLGSAFELMAPSYPRALGTFAQDPAQPARQLVGASLASIESLLKACEHRGEPLAASDLVELKRELVERDAHGLIEFIESDLSLDSLYGLGRVKAWLRQDLELWRQGELDALPMGYLLCGPVGTGKTFLVRCLAGEAGVPVVRLKNFRDRWVGSTEGNLETIFRLLHALGRCFVFVDEADQALGKRESGNSDSGLSGRIYSMIAEEMSQTRNRGKIIWVLASSRPDLIEVDLKRPGRVDVKIPIFPTTDARSGFELLRALCARRGLELADSDFAPLEPLIPELLTPGAAETLAVKVYRDVRTSSRGAREALRESLEDYQSPVPADVMAFQIRIAIREASDLEFVPAGLRERFG